jgi:hypothetical protein
MLDTLNASIQAIDAEVEKLNTQHNWRIAKLEQLKLQIGEVLESGQGLFPSQDLVRDKTVFRDTPAPQRWVFTLLNGDEIDLREEPSGVQIRAALLTCPPSSEFPSKDICDYINARSTRPVGRKIVATTLRAMAKSKEVTLAKKGGPGISSQYSFTAAHMKALLKWLEDSREPVIRDRVLSLCKSKGFPEAFTIVDVLEGLKANGTLNGNKPTAVKGEVYRMDTDKVIIKIARGRENVYRLP